MKENDACKIDMHKAFTAIAQIIGAREKTGKRYKRGVRLRADLADKS